MSHFNQVANEWDSPEKVNLMQKLANNTKSVLSLNKKINILDFGCGTGLFGLAFKECALSLTGVDTSEEMLNVFKQKVKNDPSVSTLCINIEEQDLPGKYDLIVSSMAFHHLQDPMSVLQKMKHSLNKEGKIAIVDLDQEDGDFHPDNDKMGVRHFGFSAELLNSWAKKLELNLNYQIINSIDKNNKNYSQFLAIYS